jgi:hypothetical protein
MKRRLKEMEEEAAALRDMQAKVEKEMGVLQGFETPTSAVSFIYFYAFRRSDEETGSLSSRSILGYSSATKQRRSRCTLGVCWKRM